MIGNGVALDIPELIKEIDEVVKRGVPKPNIVVSERTQVLMPYHKLFDQYEEERLSDRQFGSTKSGIAPFFSDKFSKIGFQVWELFEPERLKEKIKNVIEVKNLMLEHIYHKPLLDADELFNTLMEYADMIKPEDFIDQSIIDRWYGEAHGGFHKMYVVEIVNVLEAIS